MHMPKHTHADITTEIDTLNLAEVEALRARLNISQALLCREAKLNSSTYQRWIKFLRGEPGGSCPHPRTMTAVRGALKSIVAERQAALSGDPLRLAS